MFEVAEIASFRPKDPSVRLPIKSNILRRAVTLVEVMTVVVLIGILSAVAIPKFMAFTAQNQLEADANSIFQTVLLARTQSIKTGSHYRIVFGTTTVSGSTRLSWDLYQLDASSNTISPAIRSGVGGVSVVSGILSDASAYSGSKIKATSATTAAAALVAGLGTIDANGYEAGNGASPGVCPAAATESWSGGVEFCGGAVGDLETGGIHLYSKRSSGRAYAIVFDRNKGLQPKLLRWMGNVWEVI